ncbi:MAG: efflux RND transporter periplasmic adaptor subunit [Xanthomonadaceae bacterium]|nr:efflux RND transporter periplasmic adaptor subunit [Xanthomonadaceae bacterium]
MKRSVFHTPSIDRSTSLWVAATLVVLTACGPTPAPEPPAEPSARVVRVTEARLIPPTETIRFPATLRARQRAALAFLQSGQLAERRVERGESVRRGQLLAVLHNPALQPGVAAARGAVAEADTRLEQLQRDTHRLKQLVERELVSEDELEQAVARRDAAIAAQQQAQARLDEAAAQLDEAGLRAPFDARVADLMAEPGDFAAAGEPVMLLIDEGRLEAEIRLPAERAAALDRDHSARLRRLSDGRTGSAVIRAVGQAAPGRTAPIVMELEASDAQDRWRSGDSVDIELQFTAAESVAVPLSAIISPGTGISRVFRVRNGRSELISVQIGRTWRDQVAILGPIQPGDLVVTAGHTQLLDDEPVRIIR